MIVNLQVENYQSIGKASLDLGQVNVIVGPPNHGKSALMRALTALITNETGSDFIRKGATECKVTVTLDSGHAIQWVKTAKTAEYAILWPEDNDTTVYDKMGGAVPEDVLKLLNIHAIVVDKDFSIMPQVHDQWDQPMLLRESSSRVARALAKTTKLDAIMQAQTAAARALRSERSTVKTTKDQLDALRERQKSFRDLDEMREELEDAEQRMESVRAHADALTRAEGFYELYTAAAAIVAAPAPDRGLFEEADATLNYFDTVIEKMEALESAERILKGAEEEMTMAKHESADMDQAIADVLGEFTVCPVCERAM